MLHFLKHPARHLSLPAMPQTVKPAGITFAPCFRLQSYFPEKSFSTTNNYGDSAKFQNLEKTKSNNARNLKNDNNIKSRSNASFLGKSDVQLQKKISEVLSQDDRLKGKINIVSSQPYQSSSLPSPSSSSSSSSSFSNPTSTSTSPLSSASVNTSLSSSQPRNSKNKAKVKLLLALGLLAIGSTAYTTTRERIPPQEYLD